MTLSRLEQSYRYGYQITARASSTFALAGRLLPADIQPHFWVLYGFCRLADDWVDEQPNTKLARRQLAHYRTVLAGADYPADELIWPGLMATIERFTLPRELLFDLLSGLVSDLSRVRLTLPIAEPPLALPV